MNRTEFAQELERLAPEMSTFAARRGDPSVAPSVVRKTILEALEAFPKFEGDIKEVRLFSWKILHHNVIDGGRRLQRRGEVPLAPDAGEGGSSNGAPPWMKAPGPSIETELDELQKNRALWAAVPQLPDLERRVVELHLGEELTLAEVAARLGLEDRPHRVYDAYERATRRLAALLGPQAGR